MEYFEEPSSNIGHSRVDSYEGHIPRITYVADINAKKSIIYNNYLDQDKDIRLLRIIIVV